MKNIHALLIFVIIILICVSIYNYRTFTFGGPANNIDGKYVTRFSFFDPHPSKSSGTIHFAETRDERIYDKKTGKILSTTKTKT